MSSFISYPLKQLYLGKNGKTSKRGNIRCYSVIYLTRDNPKRQNLTSFGELRNMIMGRRQPVSRLLPKALVGLLNIKKNWRLLWRPKENLESPDISSPKKENTGLAWHLLVRSQGICSPSMLCSPTNLEEMSQIHGYPWVWRGTSVCSLRKDRCYFYLERNCSIGLSTIHPWLHQK